MGQESLPDVLAELAQTGVHVLVSNSDKPLVRRLYRGFGVEHVLANRSISSRVDRRGRSGHDVAEHASRRWGGVG